MSRTFKQHDVRDVVNLDGTWEFYFPAEGTVMTPDEWDTGEKFLLEVPSVWEMLDKYRNYRGQAVARTYIDITRQTYLRLVFKGVSHTARVFLDGKEIGDHHNAFTPFALNAGLVQAGRHELLLHISNEHGDGSALHIPNDYYNYGGISRPVEMQLLDNGIFIRHIHAVTVPDGASWQVYCQAELINLLPAREITFNAELADSRYSNLVVLNHGATFIDWQFQCNNVDCWDMANPVLYLINASIEEKGVIIDDLIERIGFRTVEVKGEDILLNGKKVFPMGFNRHEDHALYGCAIPVSMMRNDLEQMKAMNANAVRTSHYPNDERFLDMCDEMGLLVWEENHARINSIENMQHPRFDEQCEACNDEMIREHFNHPSIFVWGILNECESGTEEGAAIYRKQFDQIRSLDNSRPTTFASCRHNGDLCQGMPDICSWNTYPRWYYDCPVIEEIERLVSKREPEGMMGKPLIISEFGAGAIPGVFDPVRRPRWSENRQCDILNEQLEVILNHPRIAGAFVWQFCDVRVAEETAMGRPRVMNNKGIVSEFRQPKLAFEIVKKHFKAKAVQMESS